MKTISPSQIRGVWPPLLLPWDKSWRLDGKALDANLDALIAAEPHGLYTLDTASEFFQLEHDEWQRVARRFVSRCLRARVRCPIGLGCTWTNQAGALRRIREARELGVHVIHLAPPYWLPLNEDGVLRFVAAVQANVGHLGVIVYAPPHGKIVLNGPLYRNLTAEAPCIIGTKTVGDDASAGRAMIRVRKGHSHFVHESNLVVRASEGARGCYSFLAGLSVRWMKDWWRMIEEQRWPEAEQRQAAVNAFLQEGVQPIRARGILAGSIDKSVAQLGGSRGSRQVRPPYPSVPSDLFANLQRASRKHLPEATEARTFQ